MKKRILEPILFLGLSSVVVVNTLHATVFDSDDGPFPLSTPVKCLIKDCRHMITNAVGCDDHMRVQHPNRFAKMKTAMSHAWWNSVKGVVSGAGILLKPWSWWQLWSARGVVENAIGVKSNLDKISALCQRSGMDDSDSDDE